MLAIHLWTVFHTPYAWNYYPSQLSSRIDELRLSYLLAETLMPLKIIANLSDAI